MKISRKLIVEIFGLLIVSPFIFSSIVGYYLVFNQTVASNNYAEDDIVDATLRRLEPLYNDLNSEIKDASKNIKFLSELSSIRNLVEGEKVESLVRKDFASFLDEDKTNYRLQYIDQSGEVVIDIESLGNGQFKDFESRNVKNQSYFEKISQLENGEMYTSNVEFDADNTSLSPYPFIRIGIPLINTLGEKRGMLVLSMPTDYLFDEIGKYSRSEESVFLVNQKGDYLANQDKSKEVYFSYGTAPNLFTEYPEIEKSISADSDRATIKYQNKLFVYRIIYPTISTSEVYKGSEKVWGKDSEKSFYWMLMSESSQSIKNQSDQLPAYLTFIMIVGGGSVLLIMLIFLVILKISGDFFREKTKIAIK
jgi:hypothetical protein